MTYKVAVLFAGKATYLDRSAWYHSWLFNQNDLKTDVYVHTWHEETLTSKFRTVADIACDVVQHSRDEFRDAVRSFPGYQARPIIGDGRDWIDRHFSQFWCVHQFAQRDLSEYDAVFKTRTDCFPATEKLDQIIQSQIDEVDHSVWSASYVKWIDSTGGDLSDHNLLLSTDKFSQFADPSWLANIVENWRDGVEASCVWFDICTEDRLYVNGGFDSPIAKDGFFPSWEDRRMQFWGS